VIPPSSQLLAPLAEPSSSHAGRDLPLADSCSTLFATWQCAPTRIQPQLRFAAMLDSDKLSKIYHLEMHTPQALQRKPAPAGFEAVRVSPPEADFNRRMYESVGAPWQWTDRLRWSSDAWERYVNRAALETWRGQLHGQTAGYFELERQDEGSVEIVYFGLLPEFVGQRLGGPLLTLAVEQAWSLAGTRRVWLHTCTEDHPSALANYLGRGFQAFAIEHA